MTKKIDSIGFGFVLDESRHHFLVVIPKSEKGRVLVYERFEWDVKPADGEQLEIMKDSFDVTQKIDARFDKLKVQLSKIKWKQLETTVRKEFNERLNKFSYKAGNWHIGQTAVQRLLGKELVLLMWAIEDCEVRIIPDAIKNWLGLTPEERWWLYTMTNAATGEYDQKYGWRKAIRYALSENPVLENKYVQTGIFDKFNEDDLSNYPQKKKQEDNEQ